MPLPVSIKSCKRLIFILAPIAGMVNYCFRISKPDIDWLSWTNRCLAQSYDPTADSKLKKAEITVTADDFIRLKKFYSRGKEEYYSFDLKRFNDLDYSGTSAGGILQLKTMADDIIVQTRNDHEGDVDSMTTVLNIPVKNMEPEQLDSLRDAFNYFKGKGQ